MNDNDFIHKDEAHQHQFPSDASNLIQKDVNARGYSPVAIIEVKPHEASKIPLGIYSDSEPPIGFAIQVHPDPDPNDALTTKIISLLKEKSNQYELVLLLDNYGLRTVTVEIFELKHRLASTE